MGRNLSTTMRRSLWKANPRCHYCGIKTELSAPNGADNEATLEHLYQRGDPRRGSDAGLDPEKLVIACFKCNHERGMLNT